MLGIFLNLIWSNLCTRGQYVTQDDRSRSQDVTFTESSPAVFHRTESKRNLFALHKRKSELPTFSSQKCSFSLLRGLCGGLVASSESLLGPIASGLMHLKRNKGLGGPQTPFPPLLTGTTPFFLSRLISH